MKLISKLVRCSNWFLMMTAAAIVSSLPTGSSAQDSHIQSFERGYALWKCASLADISRENSEASDLLFDDGYDAILKFFDAWAIGDLTDSDLDTVPNSVKVGMVRGQTIEFVMGFAWAATFNRVMTDIWAKLDADSTLPVEEFLVLQRQEAYRQFKEKNCVLLAK